MDTSAKHLSPRLACYAYAKPAQGSSAQTTDHDKIKSWTDDDDGVIDDDGKTKVLRIHFPDASDEDDSFAKVEWDEFFDIFEDAELSFLHSTDGDSTFHEFVHRD